MNIDCQEVTIGYHEGKLCCFIKMFDQDIITYKQLCGGDREGYNLSNIIMNMQRQGQLERFLNMCYFDALIGNYDRHWENWGLCPLFDNGSSALNMLDLENVDDYIYKVLTFMKSSVPNKVGRFVTHKRFLKELLDIVGTNELTEFINKVDLVDLVNDDVCKEFLTDSERGFIMKFLQASYKQMESLI